MNWFVFFDVIAWFWATVGILGMILYLVKATGRDGIPLSAAGGAKGLIIALVAIAYLIASP